MVKEVVKQHGLEPDVLLKHSPETGCKVYVRRLLQSESETGANDGRSVCATSKENCETGCLTSYESQRGHNDFLNSVRLWEACCTTSVGATH